MDASLRSRCPYCCAWETTWTILEGNLALDVVLVERTTSTKWADMTLAVGLHGGKTATMTESEGGVEAGRRTEETTRSARTGTEATAETATRKGAFTYPFFTNVFTDF